MAAPFVTGIAALLQSYDPDLDNDDVMGIIKLSGTDFIGRLKEDRDPYYGHGLVNANYAIKFLKPPYLLAHESTGGGSSMGSTSHGRTDVGPPDATLTHPNG